MSVVRASSSFRDLFGHFAEDDGVDFVGHVDGLLDGGAGGDDAHVDLALTREADARDEARAKVDHAPVEARQVGVGVVHGDTHPRRQSRDSA